MHEYEAEEIESKLEVFHSHLTSDSGQISAVEHWGKRQLAYPIAKERTGNYVVAQFEAEPAALPEFERTLKLDDDLLRYLIVLSEGELPVPPSMRRGPDDRDARRASSGPSRVESAGSSEETAAAAAGAESTEAADAPPVEPTEEESAAEPATEEPGEVVDEAIVIEEAIAVDGDEDEDGDGDGAPISDDEERSV
jgi:small subunit ribosomal protein S6